MSDSLAIAHGEASKRVFGITGYLLAPTEPQSQSYLSPFHHADRPHAGDLAGQAGAMHHLDDLIDIFIRGGLLFGQPLPASAAGDEPCSASSRSMRRPWACWTAAVRLITRPAP